MTTTDLDVAAVADDETVLERRARALTLRNAGATFRQIADKTGVSPTQARKDIEVALREVVAESAESMIARQRAVLHDIVRANYAAAASGDIDAARVILSTLEREAKLFGLDAPTRVNVGVSDVEFAERTATLIESLGLTPPRELAVMGSRWREEILDVQVEEAGLGFDLGGGACEGDDVAVSPVTSWSNI